MTDSSHWKYMTMWEFRVLPGSESKFEQVYGPDGDWARLFRSSSGYITTQLVRDILTPRRYLTLDFWRSREEYESFHHQHMQEYKQMDERCEQMTESETALGSFEKPGCGS